MKLNSFDKVKQLTEEMVAIPSINKEPGGESAVARYIQDFYMSLPYFQAHPEQVKCFQTKNDFVVRHSTLAYVKGTKGNSNRTVILIGHIDTVGVDDFGTIREYAFRCEELPAKLRETFVLPQEVIDDIESGEYLFGRGALDMKSGVAGHMYLIQYFSEHPEELDGNLLAIGECDEEDNSKGIITALDLLEELKEKEHFESMWRASTRTTPPTTLPATRTATSTTAASASCCPASPCSARRPMWARPSARWIPTWCWPTSRARCP